MQQLNWLYWTETSVACCCTTASSCNSCSSPQALHKRILCLPSAAGDNPDQSQIVCNGCRVLLSYPRGAQSVQCSLCHIVTQVGGQQWVQSNMFACWCQYSSSSSCSGAGLQTSSLHSSRQQTCSWLSLEFCLLRSRNFSILSSLQRFWVSSSFASGSELSIGLDCPAAWQAGAAICHLVCVLHAPQQTPQT
jgi:LSD1 subclass zinc finger protein